MGNCQPCYKFTPEDIEPAPALKDQVINRQMIYTLEKSQENNPKKSSVLSSHDERQSTQVSFEGTPMGYRLDPHLKSPIENKLWQRHSLLKVKDKDQDSIHN